MSSLEYNVLKTLIENNGVSAVADALESLTETMGKAEGIKPKQGRIYIVLRIRFTSTYMDTHEKYEVTYVPWSSKRGKRIDLEDEEHAKDVSRIITIAQQMIKEGKTEESVLRLLRSNVNDKLGKYLNYNWYKYKNQAEEYSHGTEDNEEDHYIQTANYTLYCLELL